jgi:Arc/MetJ-type ribon-helix-helix transcriptional regulator
MSTRHISLPPELDRFVEAELKQDLFNSVSAYFSELVRQRRAKQIQEDLDLLCRGMDKAPPGPEPEEVITSYIKASRKEMENEGWQP